MTTLPRACRHSVLTLALATALPLHAQTHAQHQQSDDPHAAHRQATDEHAGMDHSQMDHAAMGHEQHGQAATREVQAAMAHDLPADAAPRTPIPPITPADRIAAFPATKSLSSGHAAHDKRIHYYVLANRLETWEADDGGAFGWEASAWIGGDLDRAWIRSEGERIDGTLESANVELFYGRAIARWWDAVIGVRHDFGQGDGDRPPQTFVAFGVMGLAPYKFEIEATAYLGESGQTGLGLEAEYETLFTNRLIGQWLVEAELWSQDDARRGIGDGLNTIEAGFRLRYEFDRQFAPYLGIVWERAYGDTADLRRAEGHDIEETRLVVGLRTWF